MINFKKKISVLLLLLIIIESLFVFSSCSSFKVRSEASIKYLSQNDYFSGNFEDKLSDSFIVAPNEKAYIVFDYKVKGYNGTKKKKNDKTLTAEFVFTFYAEDKKDIVLKVEDFPTSDYTYKEELGYRSYHAKIEAYDGMPDEMNYRFIISVSKPIKGEITINSELGFYYNAGLESEIVDAETTRISESLYVDGSIVPESRLEYQLSSDGSFYTVIGVGEELGNKIVVPKEYNWIPVKAIADNAFLSVTTAKEIVLHEGMESIGAAAFKDCAGLESLIVPSSVTVIGEDAFAGCSNAVIWCTADSKPDGWNESFKDEETKLIWNSGEFFKKNSGLENYTFTFYDDKFPYDTLIIPESCLGGFVTAVKGDGIHDAVSNVKTLTVPRTVTAIGEYSFHNFTELTEIRFNASECEAFNSSTPVFSGAGKNTDGINVVFGDTVTTVPAAIFAANIGKGFETPNVKTASIGSSVETVGYSAFGGCESLTSVSVKRGIIESGAFEGCTSLTDVTIGENVTKIGASAFRYCKSLEDIVIGKSVWSIGNNAFDGCTSLKSISFSVPGTWYITEHMHNYSTEEDSEKMNTDNPAETAVLMGVTYPNKHWFKG